MNWDRGIAERTGNKTLTYYIQHGDMRRIIRIERMGPEHYIVSSGENTITFNFSAAHSHEQVGTLLCGIGLEHGWFCPPDIPAWAWLDAEEKKEALSECPNCAMRAFITKYNLDKLYKDYEASIQQYKN